MNKNDLEELKRLAQAATPGPWSATHWNSHASTTVMLSGTTSVIAETAGFGRHAIECAADAAFIAAANPVAVLELIAIAERAASNPASPALHDQVMQKLAEVNPGQNPDCIHLSAKGRAKAAEIAQRLGIEAGIPASPAPVAAIKTWQDRMAAMHSIFTEPGTAAYEMTERECMTKEIADLRAALAQRPAADSAGRDVNQPLMIARIKRYRDVFGVSLAEAKDAVEHRRDLTPDGIEFVKPACAAAAPGADALLRELVSQADGVPFMPVALPEELANRIRAYLAAQPVEEAAAQAVTCQTCGENKQCSPCTNPEECGFVRIALAAPPAQPQAAAQADGERLFANDAKLANKIVEAAKRAVTWLDHANCNLPDDGELGSMRADMNALRAILPCREYFIAARAEDFDAAPAAQPALTDDERAPADVRKVHGLDNALHHVLKTNGGKWAVDDFYALVQSWGDARAALRQPQEAGELVGELSQREQDGLVIAAVKWNGNPGRFPLYTKLYTAAPTSKADAEDAARWRETLKHIGGMPQDVGVQRFTLRYLSPVKGTNIMRGSAAEHFTQAIDAARALAAKQAGEVKP